MTRTRSGTVLKLAALCGFALLIHAAPAPRMSAGLELFSLRVSLSVGGEPVRLRTGASESGQSHDVTLTLDIGRDR